MSLLKDITKFDQKTLSNPQVKVVKIKSKSGIEYFIKSKCNPAKLVGVKLPEGGDYNIPYNLIIEAYDDLPEGIKYKAPENPSDMEKYQDPTLKYVKTDSRNKVDYFHIEGLTNSKMIGRCLKTGVVYNIPYGVIKDTFTSLPDNLKLTKDFSASLDKAIKDAQEVGEFTKESLKGKTFIETIINGKLTKLKIEKCNSKRVSASLIDSFGGYNVPYNLIKKAS